MSLRDNIDKTIDIKGVICPYTLIETRDALKVLKNNQVLEVISDHQPAAQETIPSMCKKKNYPYEVVECNKEWRVYIKKEE